MADYKLLFAGIGLLIGGIMSLATSAIGTQCYNDNKEYGDSKVSNKSFLIYNLIVAILIVLCAIITIYYSFRKNKDAISEMATSTMESATSA
jgi:ABC-type antimicrobial peptide transport system permease subunit